jgi:hypothetical protein
MTSEIEELSARQLAAYNRADVDALCACFHDEVEILGEDGAVDVRGIDAFRDRYATMFATHDDVRATVAGRLVLGPHVVEHEAWSRTRKSDGRAQSGEVLVRYTARDGKLRWVQFLRVT